MLSFYTSKILVHVVVALFWAIIFKLFVFWDITTFWSAWLFLIVFLCFIEIVKVVLRYLLYDKEDIDEANKILERSGDKLVTRLKEKLGVQVKNETK